MTPTPPPQGHAAVLVARKLRKAYGTFQVLKAIDFELSEGEIVAIVGASGAGKTTFLQVMGTLDRPDTGSVRLRDVDPFRLKNKALNLFRNKHIGFVFQFHNLIPEFNSLENICLPAYIGGQSTRHAETKAQALLSLLDISSKSHHFPSRLSGGEAQRVAIARALINDPLVVYADEPTGNLDAKNAHNLYTLFRRLQQEKQRSFVIATHNEKLSAHADRILVMEDGVLKENTVNE